MVKLYLVNLVIPACVLNGFLHLDGLFWTQLLFLLNLEVYLLLLQKKFKKSFKKVQKKKKKRKKKKNPLFLTFVVFLLIIVHLIIGVIRVTFFGIF